MNMNIAIINYPNALKSAIFGLEEMFLFANQLGADERSNKNAGTSKNVDTRLSIDILNLEQIGNDKTYHYIILPPSQVSEFYLKPSETLKQWLINQHKQKSVLCSACAGVFILAAADLLVDKTVTTHWALSESLQALYPNLHIDSSKIIFQDHDIITAGGMMSWLDLGLTLVQNLFSAHTMRQLGKMLVIDTGKREQCFYQQFNAKFDHKDELILTIQKALHNNIAKPIAIKQLAADHCLTERTLSRRFKAATQLSPREYLQELRIKSACTLLETSTKSIELIASEVAYQDVGAFRKIFVRIMGLSPRAYRKRFA